MLKEIEEFNEKRSKESPEKVDIVCTICKGRVGYIIPAECEIPLNGGMIHPHVGCEGWGLPGPWHGALDFICPHASHPEGDQHLFIDIVEGRHEGADTFIDSNHQPYRVGKISGVCPCGCGGNVREGNTYAENLICYRRAVAQLKTEIEDGRANS
jgi:hypothetical protein